MSVEQSVNHVIILDTGSDARSAWADIVMPGTKRVVTPELAEQLLELYPSLARHACKSGEGSLHTPSTFGEQLRGALLPHAAEHLAIEYLVRAHPGEAFAGNTIWLSRKKQLMRVRLSLPKAGGAEQSLGAIAAAIEQLNELLVP